MAEYAPLIVGISTVLFILWGVSCIQRNHKIIKKAMEKSLEEVIGELEISRAKYMYYSRNETDPELLNIWTTAIESLDNKIKLIKEKQNGEGSI